MKRLILPLLLVLVAAAGGIGAGLYLRPHEPAAPAAEEAAQGKPATEAAPPGDPPKLDYVKLSNQFVIPIVEQGRIGSLVVLSLSLGVIEGQSDTVLAKEPKLRDSLLQHLFDHANSGGFSGDFTEAATLDRLRRQLLETAQSILPGVASEILITDIARQDS